MQKKITGFFLPALVLVFVSFHAFSQDIPDKPVPPRLVNDFAGMLSRQEVNALEQKLVSFNDSTSTQIAIVTVPDLHGYDKADFAQRLGEKWGIGQKGRDNGLLILVKPKTNTSRGEVFIAPGYGVEGAVPDILAAEIVDYEILPAFRSGNYYEGLDRATTTVMSLVRGEFTADQYRNSRKKSSESSGGIFVIIFLAILFISVFSRKKGGPNQKNISTGGLPFWLLLSMMGSGNRSHRGSWGGFSGGGFGGGGGGFGGFGGGGFGGGGAGGSW